MPSSKEYHACFKLKITVCETMKYP